MKGINYFSAGAKHFSLKSKWKKIIGKKCHLLLQLGHHEESAPLTQLAASVRMSRSHHRIKNIEKTREIQCTTCHAPIRGHH
jgi:hypothetical protein